MSDETNKERVYKTSKAVREAVARYEENKVDRINCRFPKELNIKERVLATGAKSVNDFIITVVTEKLDAIEKGQGVFSAKKAD